MQPDEQPQATPTAPQMPVTPVVAAPAPVASPPQQPVPVPTLPAQPMQAAVSPQMQVDSPQEIEANTPVEYDDDVSDQPSELPTLDPITWQSKEYTQHEKSPLWYIVLGVVVIALMGIAIWLGAWSFAVLVPVMVVALMVYTHRPPQVINYTVSEQGLFINDTLHPMGEFKAFAVGQELEHHTLVLVPVKRFRPAIKVFFPQEVGEQLVDMIGAYLPSQDFRVDMFDKIIQKLHI